MATTRQPEPTAIALEALHEGAIPNSDRGIAAIVELTKKSHLPEIVEVALPDAAEAAMKAVETALATPDDGAASAAECATFEALATVNAFFRTRAGEGRDVIEALDTLAGEFGHEVVSDEESAAADWERAWSVLDEGEAEQALRLIMRGEIDDCLHHLERALPAEFAAIAEHLARHVRNLP